VKLPTLPKSVVDLSKKYSKKPASKKAIKFLNSPLFRKTAIGSLFAIAAYILLISSTAFFIYHRHTQNRFTHSVERIFPYPAAVVHGQVIPLQRFRLEVEARTYYANAHAISTNEKDTEQFVMTKLINNVLYSQALTDNKIVTNDSDVQIKLEAIYKQVGGQDKLEKFLRENYGNNITLAQFRIWIQESLVASAVENQLLTQAKVRHILISLPASPTDAQTADAKKRIEDIRAKIIADPTQFAALAKQYSEDVNSRDKGGELGTTVEGGDAAAFSTDFEKAVFTLPIGKVSEPVMSRYGLHLIIVDERTGTVTMSLPDYTKKLLSEGKVHQFYSI
jgi:hypothetical protein